MHLGTVRTEFGRFGRQVSGYSFEHLLPERGRRFDRFLVGTEGTLARRARGHRAAGRGRRRPGPGRARRTPTWPTPPTPCPALLDHGRSWPARGSASASSTWCPATPTCPRAAAGSSPRSPPTPGPRPSRSPRRRRRGRPAWPHRVVDGPGASRPPLWRIREDGAGLAAALAEPPAQAGWEDAAVPPERLGAYLRDFDALLPSTARSTACPTATSATAACTCASTSSSSDRGGRARYRRFVEDAADLVAAYGGSMSGEHGDGRARSELLPRMYSPEAIALLAAGQAHPATPTTCSTPACWSTRRRSTPTCGSRAAPAPHGSARRCGSPTTTASFCRRRAPLHRRRQVPSPTTPRAGGVMCPSYLATREEKDSTRGRARVLQDVATGTLGFGDPAVARRARPVPVVQGLRAATARPASTWRPTSPRCCSQTLPPPAAPRARTTRWASCRAGRGSTPPRLANTAAAQQGPRPDRQGRRRRRPAPQPAARSPTAAPARPRRRDRCPANVDVVALGRLASPTGSRPTPAARRSSCWSRWACGPPVIPERGVLRADLDHHRPARPAARRIVGQAVATLHPYVASGTPVDRAGAAAAWPRCARTPASCSTTRGSPRSVPALRTLAELLAERVAAGSWTPPDLTGVEVVPSRTATTTPCSAGRPTPRCSRRPAPPSRGVGGCCGLAGNFGVEQGHYEVSVAVAEHDLLPAVRNAGPEAVVWPTGSPAGPSSTTSPDGVHCTSRSCCILVLPRFRAAGRVAPCVWVNQACSRARVAAPTSHQHHRNKRHVRARQSAGH